MMTLWLVNFFAIGFLVFLSYGSASVRDARCNYPKTCLGSGESNLGHGGGGAGHPRNPR
jgi:hypothetical protein